MTSLLFHVFITVTVATLLAATSLPAALPAYYFADFEADGGWKLGAVSSTKAAVQLVQGAAEIAAVPEKDSQQVLALGPSTPFAAVFVDTLAVGKAPVVFCELLAKPASINEASDAEFFDFGGAVLGFFRVGNHGELRALYDRAKEESVWISTGARFELAKDGSPVDWLQILVRLDRRTGRWDLRVNSVALVNGLQALKGEAAGLPFWLYGQETEASRFDDVLFTTVEPANLEKLLALDRARKVESRSLATLREAPKVVTQTKPSTELRNAQPMIQKAERELTVPVLRGWDETLQIGATTYKPGPEVEINGRKTSLLVYAPGYDDEGKPLAGVITITADAELRPGTDLSRIRWLMAEVKKWPDELAEIFAAGNFRTGLVQTIHVPGEWTRKATMNSVWVQPGRLDPFWWQFSLTKHTESLPQ